MPFASNEDIFFLLYTLTPSYEKKRSN